jgi:hypothetical protein
LVTAVDEVPLCKRLHSLSAHITGLELTSQHFELARCKLSAHQSTLI